MYGLSAWCLNRFDRLLLLVGSVSQSVKEIVTELVSDGLIDSDKIGT